MSCAHKQASLLPTTVKDPCDVNQINCSADSADREVRRRRALSIVGAFACGVDDLSVNHDEYLAEAYANPDGDA